MIVKKTILPESVRKVPRSFSWIDHRLVRDGHIKKCSLQAAALYLFLVCVGDKPGAQLLRRRLDLQAFGARRTGSCECPLGACAKTVFWRGRRH